MKKYLPHIALLLVVLQLLLMLLSWLYSAAYPVSGVHSLLSGEGLRWLFGSFADMLATPLLVSIILLSMAYGCVRRAGTSLAQHTFRSRRAWQLSAVVLVVCVAVMLLLTAVPHAVLLSATGRLWPSPFSRSLLPVVAFVAMLTASVYGYMAGRFASLSDIYEALLDGLRQAAPLLLFYVLVMQIYESLRFVMP